MMIARRPESQTSSMSTRSVQYAHAAVASFALALGVGCSASAEVPEVVVTRSDVAFEGVPFIPGVTDVSQTQTRLQRAGVSTSDAKSGRRPGSQVLTVRSNTGNVPTIVLSAVPKDAA